MAERDEQRFNQIGLAFRLATDQFAYADLQNPADYYLLGFRPHQIATVSYATVMSRARDIVVKAIADQTLPAIFVPEEQEAAKENKVVVPSKPQYDPVGESDAYAKDKSSLDPDSIPSAQDELTQKNTVEVPVEKEDNSAEVSTTSKSSNKRG